MATHAGKEGTVKVGASPTVVAEVREWSLNTKGDVAENSSLPSVQSNGGWRTYLATLKSWDGSLECWWDETDTNGQVTLTVGASVDVKLYPEGADNTDTYFSGTAIITAANRKGELNGIVEASFTFQGTGALASATVSS